MGIVEEKQLWVDDCNYKDSVNYKNLSKEEKGQVDFFAENGYVIFKGDIEHSLIDNYLLDYDKWRKNNANYLSKFNDDEGHLPRVINIHEKFNVLKKVFTSSKALAFQDLIFQAETIMYTSLFFERGTSQPIHRDIPYFWTNPSNHYFGMWVALEDATPRNGALMGVPQGHKLTETKRDTFIEQSERDPESIKGIDPELWKLYQDDLAKNYTKEGLKATHIPLEKGDVIVWHPLFPHGGGTIAKPTPSRKSIVFHTIPKDVPVYQADTFFNSKKEVPATIKWPYAEFETRLFIKRNVNIGHSVDFSESKIDWGVK